MSQITWTASGYGADEELINQISLQDAWSAFLELKTNKSEDTLNQTIMHYFDTLCTIVPDEDAFDEEDKDAIIRLFYEEAYDFFIPESTAVVLADLVASHLNISLSDMAMDKNENGEMVIGVQARHPWDTPDTLKNASENDYKEAFVKAFAMLGVTASPDDIEQKAIENWSC